MTAYAEGSLWYYAPNKIAPIVFAALFLISGLVHVFQAFRYRCWRMVGFLPWGCAVLTGGYAMRAVGARDDDGMDWFISSTVLLVCGPPVYAATLYVVLGRVMYYIPWLAPIHPGRVITTFLGLDLLCELLLGAGAPRISNHGLSKTEQAVGWDLIKVGMILQVLLLLGFIVLATYFHHNCSRSGVGSKIRGIMILCYCISVLILERTILRTAEMFEGYTGKIYTTEGIFYGLEASVMLIVSLALSIWHPATLLPSSNKVYLSVDGVTERLGPGWVDKRPFIMTLIDPFDCRGLHSKRHANVKFWEQDQGEVINMTDRPKKQTPSPA